MQSGLLETPVRLPEKENAELDKHAVKTLIDLHKTVNIPFACSVTNYTTHLESELRNILFQKEHRSTQMFAAYQYLKKDIEGKNLPHVDPDKLRYYINGFNGNQIYSDKIYNIDLKAAYATILFNKGILSKKTYRYLMRLPKIERLVSVGMLASRKNTFHFNNNGRIIAETEVISPYSNFFFAAVKETYDIMNEAKVILGNDFLFSWVDGIYFMNRRHKTSLMNFLKARNLKASFSVLKEFEIEMNHEFHRLSYMKDGQKKYFIIPISTGYLNRNKIISYLKSDK
jgi:hypothetical protein